MLTFKVVNETEYGFSPLPEEFGIHETRSNKSAVGPDWLFDKLEAAVSALPVADLAKSVVRILFSDKSKPASFSHSS